jgi:hypothetical protein
MVPVGHHFFNGPSWSEHFYNGTCWAPLFITAPSSGSLFPAQSIEHLHSFLRVFTAILGWVRVVAPVHDSLAGSLIILGEYENKKKTQFVKALIYLFISVQF